MPIPAIIGTIASVLGWIGIDLGISWLTSDSTNVEYVRGLDFPSFIGLYWLSLLLYGAVMLVGLWIALPKNAGGRGPRYRGRIKQLDTMSKTSYIAALAAVLVSVIAAVSLVPMSDAAGEDLSGTYGEATVIEIAPGFEWRYTPEFPEDLTEFVTVSLEVNDGSVGYVDGSMVIVTIPEEAASGTTYNVVIEASMTEPVEQTAYQYVRFVVVDGLSVSGTINDIIAGTRIDFSPIGESDMGDITWTVKSGTELPAGLELADGKVSGTPTGIGLQTVSLTANCRGETADLVVTFTVYSKIVGDSEEIIASYGNTVSSRTITNAEDIGVTWTVSEGTLPAGFSLDPSTGVVSGSSTDVNETIVTITGTSTIGPEQTVTKQITIRSEPDLVLSSEDGILTYLNNANAVTATVAATQTSQISWQVSGYDGATVTDGIVSVSNPATAGMGQELTVTATTAYGQTETAQVRLDVEDTLTISGDDLVSAIVGTAKQTSAFTVSGGSSNSISASTETVGLTATIQDDCLSVQSASPMQDAQVTVTVTSAAGQTASATVMVDVYNVLVFSSQPTGGAVIYPM